MLPAMSCLWGRGGCRIHPTGVPRAFKPLATTIDLVAPEPHQGFVHLHHAILSILTDNELSRVQATRWQTLRAWWMWILAGELLWWANFKALLTCIVRLGRSYTGRTHFHYRTLRCLLAECAGHCVVH